MRNRYLECAWIAISILLLVSCGSDKSERDYYHDARESYLNRDYSQAVIQIKNALQQNPDFPEGRILYGEILLEQSDFLGAKSEFYKALDLGAQPSRLAPMLVRAHYSSGDFNEVDEWPLDALDEPARAQVLAHQGLALLARIRLEEARTKIEQAMLIGNSELTVLLADVSLMNIENHPADQVRASIANIQSLYPEDLNSWILLGDLERREGNFAPAEENYSRAIDGGQRNFLTLLKRATLRNEMGALESAQQDIDGLLSINRQSPVGHYIQGILHYKNMSYGDAIASFELPLNNESRFPMALFYAAASHLAEGNLEQADVLATRHFSASPAHTPGRILLSNIRLAQKQYEEVEQLLRPIVGLIDQNPVALNLLGSALLSQGNYDEALYYLDRVVLLVPDSPVASLRYSVALSAAGDFDKATEYIEKSIAISPEYKEAYTMLAMNYLKQGDLDSALRSANRYLEVEAESPYSYNLQGQIYLSRDDTNKAREKFQEALALDKGNITASLSLMNLEIAQNAFSAARILGENALQVHPNELSVLLKLATIESIQGDEQAMIQRLRAAADAHTDALQPRLILARYYLERGEPGKAKNILGSFLRAKDRSAELLEVVATTYLEEAAYQIALDTTRKLIEKRPDSANAYYLLSRAHAGLDDYEAMQKALLKVIELEPDHYAANVALAKFYSLTSAHELFDLRMSVLKSIPGQQVEVIQLDAAHQVRQGNLTGALELLETAFDTAPSTQTMLELSQHHIVAGNRAAALQVQQAWVARNKRDLMARQALVVLLQSMGHDDQAMEQYKEILAIDANNVMALKYLAWHLRESSPAQALMYAERAYSLLPESWMVLDTYAVVLLHNNEITRAKRYIERAVTLQANNPALHFHRAQIDYAAGNKADSRVTLEIILHSGYHFAERKQAEQMLASFSH